MSKSPFDRAKDNSHRAVGRDSDFRRVEALPRRTAFTDCTPEYLAEIVHALTWFLRMPNGTQTLRPIQAFSLLEAADYRGMLGFHPVGSGKTILSLLSATVMGLKRPMLLTRAALRDKTLRDIHEISKHWRIPLPVEHGGSLHILSYEQLSRHKQADIFDRLQPDGVICDEAQALAHKTAACTKRVLRFAEEHPVPFLLMSGTLTKRTPKDYAHLARLSLRDGSPLPHGYLALEDWCNALGEEVVAERRIHPGALLAFGTPVRDGFRKRFVETPGVVVMEHDDLACNLTLVEDLVDVPQRIVDEFKRLRGSWQTPGGEVIMTALDFARHARELALGFYYRWVWPDGIPDTEWLARRKEWRAFVREIISTRHRGQHYDTEMQVALACKSGVLDDTVYNAWISIRDRVDPKTEAVWIHDFMVDHALEWMRTHTGIVWVEHQAVSDRLAARLTAGAGAGAALDVLSGKKAIPVFGAGGDEISLEDGSRSVVASIAAHGTGKNLQMFHDNLFLCKPDEQSLGRTHRQGQQADEVTATLVFNCVEQWLAFGRARSDALYVEQTTGQKQKLRYCDLALTTSDESVAARAVQKDPLWDR